MLRELNVLLLTKGFRIRWTWVQTPAMPLTSHATSANNLTVILSSLSLSLKQEWKHLKQWLAHSKLSSSSPLLCQVWTQENTSTGVPSALLIGNYKTPVPARNSQVRWQPCEGRRETRMQKLLREQQNWQIKGLRIADSLSLFPYLLLQSSHSS